MKTPFLLIASTLLALAVGCGGTSISSTDIGNLTEAGLLLAGKDAETARRGGAAAIRVGDAVQPMPEATEVAIGENVALRSIGRTNGIHPDNDLQLYVNTLGLSIARLSDRPGLPWTFVVLDTDEASAWACPGGVIFITAGTIKQMQDEAELAGVIAHEISHVTLRHMVTMIQRSEFVSGGLDAASIIEEKVSQYNVVADLALEILFEKGFDRKMEYQADASGVELAAVAGYDPKGLPRFLDRMSGVQGRRHGGNWLMSTHPPIRERIQGINSHLQKVGLSQVDGATARDRFQARTALLR